MVCAAYRARHASILFVLYAATNASDACNLLNRQRGEINCTTGMPGVAKPELKHVPPSDPSSMLRAHYAHCRARACGIALEPSARASTAAYRKLHPPGCGVVRIFSPPVATGLPAPSAASAASWLARLQSSTRGARTLNVSLALSVAKAHSMDEAKERERGLLQVYDALDVRAEDQICLFDRCVSERLVSARKFTEVANQVRDFEWRGHRLSQALREMRAQSLLNAMKPAHTRAHRRDHEVVALMAMSSFVVVSCLLCLLALIAFVCEARVSAAGCEQLMPLVIESPGATPLDSLRARGPRSSDDITQSPP